MIVNRQRGRRVPVERLERVERALAEAVGIRPAAFTVALVSDRRIRALNRRFRGRPYPTDVLSFPSGGRHNGYRGDIAISVDTAARQARRLGHGLNTELALLLVHGVLHLLGYDHETDSGEMNRREHALRQRLRLE